MTRLFAILLFIFGGVIVLGGIVETAIFISDGEFGYAAIGVACISFAAWRCWKKLPYLMTKEVVMAGAVVLCILAVGILMPVPDDRPCTEVGCIAR